MSAVRGADPTGERRAEATERLCYSGRSIADQWLNWTKAEEDQFLITINATPPVSF